MASGPGGSLLCQVPGCRSKTRVIDSRRRGNAVWRRRICRKCATRFSTVEIIKPVFDKLSRVSELVRGIQNA